VLATQNPVDLDYKALSNMGTWFLGRLQTNRDKMRVLDGLEGAAASQGSGFDRQRMEEVLAGLGSRVFLMNNVHEDGPVTFHVRWAMSYLRGPLSRRQIKTLMDPVREKLPATTSAASALAAAGTPEAPKEEPTVIYQLPKTVRQRYIAESLAVDPGKLVYLPSLFAEADVNIDNAKYGVHGTRRLAVLCKFDSESSVVDFGEGQMLEKRPAQREGGPADGTKLSLLPEYAQEGKFYTAAKKSFQNWIYRQYALEIFSAPSLKAYSKLGETEAEFRVRLQQAARESRDAELEKLRETFRKQIEKKEDQLERAERTLDKEEAQARSAKMSTMISVGTTVLGALFGRKRFGVGTVSRGATAARGASRSLKESRDVKYAEEKVEDLEDDLKELEREMEEEMEKLRDALDPLKIELEKVRISPFKKNIAVRECSLAWLPHHRVSDFQVDALWDA
ncbi:MAG: ATP-binding protein, partial [Verrucomicrobiota bacterium]